jgi:O-antigen/teichoic acid export membrane protein
MIATLIAGVSQLGLAQGYVYKSRKKKKNAFRFLLISLAFISLVTLLVLWLTQTYFIPTEVTPYIYLIASLTYITTLSSFFQNSAQIDPKLHSYNMTKILIPTLNIILLFVYFYVFSFGFSVTACIFIIMLTTSISLLFLGRNVLINEKNNLQNSSLTITETINYSLKMYGISLVGIFINSIDKVILLANGTMQEFGLYSVAYGLSRLIGIVPETISTVIYSRFAGHSEKELSTFINLIFSCLFIPLLLACIIIAALSPWFIPLIFGVEYSNSVLPFIFLLCECVIASLGWLLSQRFNAAGRPGLVLLRQLISTIPLIFIYFYQFQQSILITVSIALLSSAILRLVITLLVYQQVLNEKPPKLYPTLSELQQVIATIKKQGSSKIHEY